MNEHDESDSSVVPGKQANKAARAVAEPVEGRGLAKGNSREQHASRTQGRTDAKSALERIREAARRDKKLRFTALLHHVYDVDRLRAAYQALNPGAAAGIDGVNWEQYGQQLEENLQGLSERLKRGAYRARPARRVRIPKPDGRERLLGVPVLEDKIVQRATAEVLEAIYEQDFLGFSYGFRRGRNAHQALDAVSVGIRKRKVGWVLDADIRAFFDTLDHGWLVKFLEHRIADKRVIRLIQKWLKAGVLEDGKRVGSELGAVQGGSISPLLANVYLHYVFDLWAHKWRSKQAHGDLIIVRYADDFIVGFQHRSEAEQYLEQLRRRFEHFGLALHVGKTRLIEFGRFAASKRAERGAAKPETFNFLGLTHFCAKARQGWFMVLRQTMRGRMPSWGKGRKGGPSGGRPPQRNRNRVVVGVSTPVSVRRLPRPREPAIAFRRRQGDHWVWAIYLCRRSQTANVTWERMKHLASRSFLSCASITPIPISALSFDPRQEPDAVMPLVRIRGGPAATLVSTPTSIRRPMCRKPGPPEASFTCCKRFSASAPTRRGAGSTWIPISRLGSRISRSMD